MEEAAEEIPVLFRDIRRYYCDYCGICRSKKSLITSHIVTHHKEDMEKAEPEAPKKSDTCEECGVSFKKPAHLKQHMQSHILERPFVCSVDDCHASYRRKDHLSRHLLQHQGKLFKCPVDNCNIEFAFQGNMKRHVKEFHDEDCPSEARVEPQKQQYMCKEVGCGKVFRYESRLRKHEGSHVKLDTVEAICTEPGCMKVFSNEKCLRDHIHSCHQYITCDVCGTKQLKKNIKRHLCMHEANKSTSRIKCTYEDCDHTFSSKSNLQQHVKAVHLEHKPFACGFSGCSMRFSYKHVRDNHEKTGLHVYTHGDFEDSDEQFRLRPRGGRKRQCPSVETLIRKRVTPPNLLDSEYFSQLLSEDALEEL